MDAYEISERDGGYVVLAHGEPLLLFATLREAETALAQIQALDKLPRRYDALKVSAA